MQMDAFKENNLSSNEAWNRYNDFRDRLRQKLSDMLCQREDYESSYSKGQITAYGTTNTDDRLLKDYGVLVKRQNGNAITAPEIQQIKSSLDRFYALMGNFSSIARDYHLKISHAGDKKMFASRFSGLFTFLHHAIGVSFRNEETAPAILAHELAHFLDAQAGSDTQHFFASDNASSPEYAVAAAFRSLMNKNQSVTKSAYYNRTCECFARALEQYTAFHTLPDHFDRLSHTPAYTSHENFTGRVVPAINRYVIERQRLLNPRNAPSIALTAAQKNASPSDIPKNQHTPPPIPRKKTAQKTASMEW
jgi:hypothetical protein